MPLIACASEGQSRLLQHLLRQDGVDPDVKDLNGNTAEGLAQKNGQNASLLALRERLYRVPARSEPAAGGNDVTST